VTRRPLAALLPAVADVLGVPAFSHDGAWLAQGIPGVREVVVLLVDGLGDDQLRDHRELTPVLSGELRDLGGLVAPFPSTTSVSLTSFGTGLPPGQHGIVSTSFRLEDGSTLSPLTWAQQPNPIATQPEPTVFERAEAAGVVVTTAAPPQFAGSGLTRAALRGGTYQGAASIADRARVVRDSLMQARDTGRPALTYVYWPHLDKAGHVHGVDSAPYRAALQQVDLLVETVAGALTRDAALLVTADHGLVDVPDECRVDLESEPLLRVGVERILGEPRERQVYCQPGQASDVADRWSRVLGDRAQVLHREQVVGLLGPVDDWHLDRIGDVVAIAEGSWALVSDRVDSLVSSLRGQHGGLTAAEVNLPLRCATGA
jgi:Type I phosphodiesterase / nucleotide pyrophosphatase